MKISQWLALATSSLTDSGITTARLDSLVLLEDATGRDRAWLLAHDDSALTDVQLDRLADWLERRLQHEPLAYIRGFQEFYGRRFTVTPDVLVPRPESESMIDLLIKLAPRGAAVADIGTGSGCLAVTATLETAAVVAAVDIDEACLAVAERNAVLLSASLQLVQSSLLEPFLSPGLSPRAAFEPEIVLANLPYVPDEYPINDAARHEPALALFAGPDGLDLYRQLFGQVVQLAVRPMLIITEALESQHDLLSAIAHGSDYELLEQHGLAQAFRPFP